MLECLLDHQTSEKDSEVGNSRPVLCSFVLAFLLERKVVTKGIQKSGLSKRSDFPRVAISVEKYSLVSLLI